MNKMKTCLLFVPGASPTAESISKPGGGSSSAAAAAAALPAAAAAASQSVVRPKQQLLYLADVLGFQVQFTDFPKVSQCRTGLKCVLNVSRVLIGQRSSRLIGAKTPVQRMRCVCGSMPFSCNFFWPTGKSVLAFYVRVLGLFTIEFSSWLLLASHNVVAV